MGDVWMCSSSVATGVQQVAMRIVLWCRLDHAECQNSIKCQIKRNQFHQLLLSSSFRRPTGDHLTQQFLCPDPLPKNYITNKNLWHLQIASPTNNFLYFPEQQKIVLIVLKKLILSPYWIFCFVFFLLILYFAPSLSISEY